MAVRRGCYSHARQTHPARRHRRHRRLQESGPGAAAARARRRSAGRHDAGGRPLRDRHHLPGRLGPRRAQRAVGRGGGSGHGTHRTRPLGRPGADRPGERGLPGAPRGRAGRRPARDAVSGDAGADRRGASHEPSHVGERGDPRQRGDAHGARHPRSRSGGGRPGLRRERPGPHARATGPCGARRHGARALAAVRSPGGACSSPRVRRASASIRCASSATAAPGRWVSPSHRRRARRARAWYW